MSLLNELQKQQLLENGHADNSGRDHFPVVKIFTPDANATWLLTELDPDEPDIAFGLCDLGLGFPELGYVLISELEALRGHFGRPVECDSHFKARHPISVYARAASLAQEITYDAHLLSIARLDTVMPPRRPLPPQPR